MDGTHDSNLVFQTDANDLQCTLSLFEEQSGIFSWVITTTRGVMLRSVQGPTEEVLRLFKEPWDEPNYFHSHQPLFQILTNSSFSQWVLDLQTANYDALESISVSIIPAIFVTEWLKTDYSPSTLFSTSDDNLKTEKKKRGKKKNTSAEALITATTDDPSLMKLWMRDIVLDIGIIDDKNVAVGNAYSYYSQLFSLGKRFSAVYSPISQKGDYPIWKKNSPLQVMSAGGIGEEEKDLQIYLYVDEKTKRWVVSTIFPDQDKQITAKENILLQSQTPISAKDEELALVAYNEELSKVDSNAMVQYQQRLLTSSLWTINISDRCQQQVEVWLSPHSIWDSSKTSFSPSTYSSTGGIAVNRVTRCSKEFATQACLRISSIFHLERLEEGEEGETSFEFSAHWMGRHLSDYSIKELVSALFSVGPCNWVQVNDSLTSPIILEISRNRCSEFDVLNFDYMFAIICSEKRIKDMTALVSSDKVHITSDLLCETVFRDLPKATTNQFANKLALETKTIVLKSKADYKRVVESATGKLGKGPHKNLLSSLNRGIETLQASSIGVKSSFTLQTPHPCLEKDDVENEVPSSDVESMDEHNTSFVVPKRFEKMHSKIDSLILWYEQELLDCRNINEGATMMTSYDDDNDYETGVEDEEKSIDCRSPSPTFVLTGEELSVKLDEFSRIPDQEEQDKFLYTVERHIDLKTWEGSIELPVLITEQAHKWFQRRAKKHMRLCERVMRRLRLLATGRRSYVLCKPLRTNNSSIRLYESKIDAARRIIWEDALTFSPRCSIGGSYFAETGVRVWEIVEDHDNLSRAIQVTIDRIEKSHARGSRCMLFTELIDAGTLNINFSNTLQDVTPSRYPIQEKVRRKPQFTEENKSRPLNHPANEDEKQFNLLKFYELNYDFVKVMLDKEGM
jgi:hypothetical protein